MKIIRKVSEYLVTEFQISKNEQTKFLYIVGGILLLPIILTNDWFYIIDFNNSGEVGDTIGGITAPFLSIIGSVLIYLTLKSQIKANKEVSDQINIQNFETKFFEMLRVYRENINDWKLLSVNDLNKNMNERYLYEGRIVANQIYGLFKELFEEIDNFLGIDNKNVDLFIEEKYKNVILNIGLSDNSKITDLAEFIKLELSLIIIYYGVGNFSIENLNADIKGLYKSRVLELFNFLNLKPIRSSNFWDDWLTKKKNRDVSKHKGKQTQKETAKYFKYYGGHEHRLGHYFRHLYSTIRYVNKQSFLTYSQKWEYITMLRAQMSNKEQFLLYLFSISFLGRNWEISPSNIDEVDENNFIQRRYITKYDLVKYIPRGTREIYFKNNYYPDVQYIEQPNLSPNRELLEIEFKKNDKK